jgi:hypothetical protein
MVMNIKDLGHNARENKAEPKIGMQERVREGKRERGRD